MPINLQGSGNIAEGWGPPPQLHAPELGSLVHAILGNRLGQQELTQKSMSDAIKQMNEQRDSEAFLRAAQQAGIIPQGDYSGMDAKSIAALASGIAAQTKDTDLDAYHQALAGYYNRSPGAGMGGGRGSGTPRYDYHGVLLPGSEYLNRMDQDRATAAVGKLSELETTEQTAADAISAKWGGVDLNSSGFDFVKKPGGWMSPSDPQKEAEYQRDFAEFQRHSQAASKAKLDRINYTKWRRGQIQPGGNQPGGIPDDEEDTPLPQGGAVPPPQAQASPSPAGTPRPNQPPPADSAAGHAPTYGTPSSPGTGQVGDLVVGVSKRPINGKMYTWWGDRGWLPD